MGGVGGMSGMGGAGGMGGEGGAGGMGGEGGMGGAGGAGGAGGMGGEGGMGGGGPRMFDTDMRGYITLTEALADGENEVLVRVRGKGSSKIFRPCLNLESQEAWPNPSDVPVRTVEGEDDCGLFDTSVLPVQSGQGRVRMPDA